MRPPRRRRHRGFTEQFIIATVDVALFAQNVVVAAESRGLGICYIGALRNDPQWVSELLALPRLVYPVFGLCLGYPAQDPEIRCGCCRRQFCAKTATTRWKIDWIERYDDEVREHYRTRTGNNKSIGWSEQMAGLLGKESCRTCATSCAARFRNEVIPAAFIASPRLKARAGSARKPSQSRVTARHRAEAPYGSWQDCRGVLRMPQ